MFFFDSLFCTLGFVITVARWKLKSQEENREPSEKQGYRTDFSYICEHRKTGVQNCLLPEKREQGYRTAGPGGVGPIEAKPLEI